MSATAPHISGVDFVTVFVDDFPAAVQFYETTLGLPCSARYEQIAGAEFETGNLTIQVLDSAAIGRPFEASGHPIALHVDDVETARAALEAQGISFGAPTMDSGVCHMAFFTDPAGNALMFHHRYTPRSAD